MRWNGRLAADLARHSNQDSQREQHSAEESEEPGEWHRQINEELRSASKVALVGCRQRACKTWPRATAVANGRTPA
jgi:hypothetical protein